MREMEAYYTRFQDERFRGGRTSTHHFVRDQSDGRRPTGPTDPCTRALSTAEKTGVPS
jgi:hypothetical protein